jgi:hypothetical protein
MYELYDATCGPFLYMEAITQLDFPLITADTTKTTTIVLKLVQPLLEQGGTWWIDNFWLNLSSQNIEDCNKTD